MNGSVGDSGLTWCLLVWLGIALTGYFVSGIGAPRRLALRAGYRRLVSTDGDLGLNRPGCGSRWPGKQQAAEGGGLPGLVMLV
jgi:hypothetical protein